jgi:uncharacterized membrane protein YfcA
LLGGISFLILGYTDLPLLGYLLLGSITAAILGSALIKEAPLKLIKLLLAIILCFAGIKLILT